MRSSNSTNVQVISIRRHPYSYQNRIIKSIGIYLATLVLSIVISLLTNNFKLYINFLAVFWIALLIPVTFSIRKDYRYIYEFISDGNTFKLKYLKVNESNNIEGLLSNLNINILNQTSRSGFHCELKVSFENQIFFIREQNDWTLDNMKEIFLFIKRNKSEELDERERFNLEQLVDKSSRLRKQKRDT